MALKHRAESGSFGRFLLEYIAVILTIVIGVAVSLVAFAMAQNWESQKARLAFERMAENHYAALGKSLDSYATILESLAALYAGSVEVERHEFRVFVNHLLGNNEGIQALEWVPRVPSSRRREYEDAAQDAGYPGFRMTERDLQGELVVAGNRREYYPVYFMEPYQRNALALGFDLASNPQRRRALHQARDSGDMVATSRVRLVQETGKQYGFLILRPLYSKDVEVGTVAARRLHLQGFVLGVFRVNDIVERATENIFSQRIGLRLYDMSARSTESFLYSSWESRPDTPASRSPAEIAEPGRFHTTRSLEVCGRKWVLQFAATPDFGDTRKSWQPLIIMLFMLLLTGLLASYLSLGIRRTGQLSETNQRLGLEIDERMQVEGALRAERNRAQMYLDVAGVMLLALDDEGYVTLVNRRGCDILGYDAADIVGKPWFDHFLPEEDREAVRDVYRQMMAGIVEPHERRTNPVLTKNGEKRAVDWKNTILRDEKSVIIGTFSSGEDITERKKAEDELQRVESRLQRAEKMEALGTLAGGVAHDLNNVLSGIVTYPDLLLMQIPKDSPLRRHIAVIQESGEKAVAIVQDLLTLARRGVASTKVVNLNGIAMEYLKSPEHDKLQLTYPNLQVETTLDPDLLNISGSPVHLSKTIMNIILNAAEAMPDGGKVVLSTENRYIDRPVKGYDTVDEGDYAVIAVSDRGIGILPEDRDRIFEPFYSKKISGSSGTGLGMAVVWGTVRDHKGYIDVRSEPGKGSTFTLYFPATREEMAGAAPKPPLEDYRGSGESILVVDGIENQRMIATSLLSELGYSVAEVSSGREAVEYLKGTTVDLLVLDMIMEPGMDGLDTYRQIVDSHPGQRAVIASGYSETDRVKAAQKLGAGQYVRKPYTLETIGLAVKNELNRT